MTAYTPSSAISPDISIEEFMKFREFFYRKTGISFDASKRYFVDKRLVERIAATGSDNFLGYFALLRYEDSGVER
jgi:chemotaxis protein methyltransferase CheR